MATAKKRKLAPRVKQPSTLSMAKQKGEWQTWKRDKIKTISSQTCSCTINVKRQLTKDTRPQVPIYIMKHNAVDMEYDWLKKEKFAMIILDEGHIVRSMSSKRSLMLIPVLQQSLYCILLTGTPFSSLFVDFYHLIIAIQPRLFHSFEAFADQFVVMGEVMSNEGILFEKPCNNKNIGQMGKLLRRLVLFRYSKEHDYRDCMENGLEPTFVPKYRFIVWIQMEDADRVKCEENLKEWYGRKKQLRDEKNEHKKGIKGDGGVRSAPVKSKKYKESLSVHQANNYANMFYTKISQEMSVMQTKYFVPLVEPFIRLIFTRGEKVIFFAKSVCKLMSGIEAELDRLRPLLHFDYIKIDGSTDGNQRSHQVDLFNQSTSLYKVAILSTGAASSAISLVGGNHIVFLDLDSSPLSTLQAEDRTHRINQTIPCFVHYWMLPNSIHQEECNLFFSKVSKVKFVLDQIALRKDEVDRLIKTVMSTRSSGSQHSRPSHGKNDQEETNQPLDQFLGTCEDDVENISLDDEKSSFSYLTKSKSRAERLQDRDNAALLPILLNQANKESTRSPKYSYIYQDEWIVPLKDPFQFNSMYPILRPL